MLMMLLQFQFTNTTEDERNLIPSFCNWLCRIIYTKIDTKINRKKVSLRLNYILDKVDWINWDKNKYSLSTTEIFNAISNSFTYEQYKNNLWKINIDSNVLIPHSYTSIDRLIRFLNYGDNKQRGTGMFSNMEQEFNHIFLNNMWSIYCVKYLGRMTESKIIAR